MYNNFINRYRLPAVEDGQPLKLPVPGKVFHWD